MEITREKELEIIASNTPAIFDQENDHDICVMAGSVIESMGYGCALFTDDGENLVLEFVSIPFQLKELSKKLTGIDLDRFSFPHERFSVYRELLSKQELLYYTDSLQMSKEVLDIYFKRNAAPAGVISRSVDWIVDSAAMKFLPDVLKQNLICPVMVEKQVNGYITVFGPEVSGHARPTIEILAGIVGSARSNLKVNARLQESNKALRRSEVEKKAILDGITSNLAYVDKDLKIKWVNITAANSAGKTPSAMKGDHCYEFWGDSKKPCDGCPTVKAFKTGQTEKKIIHAPDGRVWEEKGEPVISSDGELIGVVEIATDITKTVAAQEQLKENEKKFRSVFEGTGIAMAIVAPDGRLLLVNDKTCEVLGFSRSELHGKTYTDITHPEDIENSIRKVKGLLNGDYDSYHHEKRYICKDGSIIWADLNLSIVRNEDGLPQYAVAQLSDISNRKRAETALRTSEARFRSLFEDSPISLWEEDFSGVKKELDKLKRSGITDLDDHLSKNPETLDFLLSKVKVIDVNRTTIEMFGAESKEAFFNTLEQVFTEKSYEAFRKQVVSFFNGGLSVELETTNKTLAGEEFHISLQTQVAPGYEDTFSRVFVSIIDISERKKSEQVQKERQEQEKMAVIGRVAGKMAHDFNNVLGIVLGMSELALDEELNADVREELTAIRESAKRGRAITRNLLLFARDQESQFVQFDLNYRIGSVISALRPDLEGIEVNIDYGTGLEKVTADTAILENAFVNLIQNAIHAMSQTKHPQLHVETQKAGGRIFVRIRDNGCGIPEEFINEIFEPTFTLKGSMDSKRAYRDGIEGSGYGLSNVKRGVERHGGTISVDSKPGAGSQFTVELPVVEVELKAKDAAESVATDAPTGKRILIVEDELQFGNILHQLMQDFNHEVKRANNGSEALDLIAGDEFDVISLDFILPDITGMNVYRKIREKDATVPVVFVSGNFEFMQSMIDLKEMDPFVDHLAKPFSNAEYIKKINQWLENI